MTTATRHATWDWSAYCPYHRATIHAGKTTVHEWANQHNHEAVSDEAASVIQGEK